MSKSFPTKSLAAEWARKVESQMVTSQYRGNRSLHSITFSELIERYTDEASTLRSFGKNWTAVVASLKVEAYDRDPGRHGEHVAPVCHFQQFE